MRAGKKTDLLELKYGMGEQACRDDDERDSRVRKKIREIYMDCTFID